MTLPDLDPAQPLRVPAPAKINLFLHIVGRRPDGYHLLQTAFRMLDWGDEITLRRRDDGLILRTTDVPGVPAEADLVVRAARALQAASGSAFGAEIGVLKRIPMGGGLGGGSSDAASVLLALNRLWGCGLSRRALQEIGLKLGADVPFFVFGETAFAEGVGEALSPLAVPPAWYVVVAPPVSVPTAEIFSAKELTRDTEILIMQGFAAHKTRNDMQAVVCVKYPEVAESLEWLSQYGDARMSGSGACLFAPFDTEGQARQVAASAPSGWKVWVARGLDRHPLKDWVAG
ncbi:MAG: 4-(cytidine 5'-diphospho)-2-C-methyl-D-erythritol kinase [Zoogloea sp.]|uniref:4-(cytidine 5'-diphospho)-2-C-methyl-D-erythritol kinase n=1 Tax=Zoogloea sp. TaxID=49181 RepID=UPI00262949F5|nr:4-(cytidine 5'-diphospho)-2-C-methyl-D-erythritol kinase [Zoogloea sp.]MDD3328708.1 4-(cytidine 5'-diphospho)-2-C-methyl-D-erythritol kinase [Zoogloea sp.]